jgi:hypothetical protein
MGPGADVAQLVEHHLAKVGVAGSNPVVRSKTGGGRVYFGGPEWVPSERITVQALVRLGNDKVVRSNVVTV